jgi:16S rRNA (cytosine967-C5)-methyltransferase
MDEVLDRVAAVIKQTGREKPADAVMRAELKASKMSRADSARVAHLVFAYFRWLGLLDEGMPLEKQISGAESWDRRFQRQPESINAIDLARTVPDWAHEEVATSPALLRAWQTEPSLWIRARKGTGQVLARKLKNCREFQAHSATLDTLALPDCLQFLGRMDLFRTPEFQNGEFEIQDVASQIVGLICGAEPGQTWWDACAGEGGKTLHLSDLMENKGMIWATDRAEWRLKKLKQRASRARAFNYRLASWEGGAKRPTKTMFDGVLVDAPCSGVGTWQRNPHARWTTTVEDVRELAEVQRKLLLNAAPAVKPGGRLIYSVCTLTRSETDGVADFCSRSLAGFEPQPMPSLPNGQPGASARKWIYPQDLGGNGMFVAAWRRIR